MWVVAAEDLVSLLPFEGLVALVVSLDSGASSDIVAVCIGVVVGSFGW